MLTCFSCGHENPLEQKFCGECGAGLVAPGETRRRLITALFCDLVGSTELGERLDAERLRKVLDRYFHAMRAAIQHHGGTVEKFITLNAMLAENPPPASQAVVLAQFAHIGIGPGLDVEAQAQTVKQGLMRAAATGIALLRQQFLSGDWATIVNGWRYPPRNEGRFSDDYLLRAADQSLAGITANDPAESVYLINFDDAEGNKLSPDGRYELHFSADDLPPVDAFWSLAAYTAEQLNLIPNPAHRYSVGNHTPGLRWDADGGLTIHLQPEPPGEARDSNWLPTSASEAWFVILRMYRPHAAVIEATWRCPGVAQVA